MLPGLRYMTSVFVTAFVLCAAYLVQYWPTLGYWILNKIGPARAQGYKTGGSGYDINMLKKAK